MNFKVIWTDIAVLDLNQIVEYIFNSSPEISKKIFNQIKVKAESLNTFPLRGRVVPEFKNKFSISEFRELIEQHWRIIYFIENENVVVASVIDSRRDFNQLMADRFKFALKNKVK